MKTLGREVRGYDDDGTLALLFVLVVVAAIVVAFVVRGLDADAVPPNVEDAPYQITVDGALGEFTMYCPERGYELQDDCVMFAECYQYTLEDESWAYIDGAVMYCGDIVWKVEIVDRRKSPNDAGS